MKFSVITPSLNSVDFIERAILSVRKQNRGDIEHIVVDGGSTDGTLDILRKYPDLKWVSEPDRGQSDAMNKGFNLSSGEIVVYLNSDDYFLPDAFDAVHSLFQAGESFVVGKVKVVCDDGFTWTNDPKTEFPDMLQWWKTNAYCVNPVGYFYLRGIQSRVGGFNPDNHHSMDVEFLLDAARICRFKKIDRLLGVFNLGAQTKTKRSSSAAHLAKKFQFCEKYLPSLSEAERNAYAAVSEQFVRNAILEESYGDSYQSLLLRFVKTRLQLISKTHGSILLYPGGAHTHWLLEKIAAWKAADPSFAPPEIAGILDDNPKSGAIASIPVTNPSAHVFSSAQCVVISSDFHNAALFEKMALFLGGKASVIDLYDGLKVIPPEKERRS